MGFSHSGNYLPVVNVASVAWVMLDNQPVRNRSMPGKRRDHLLNEGLHTAVSRTQRDLGIACDLKRNQEKRCDGLKLAAQAALGDQVKVLTQKSTDLGQQIIGLWLQFMRRLNDGVGREGMLDEGGSLPQFSPADTRFAPSLRDHIHRRKSVIEIHRLVEVGSRISTLQLKTHIIRPDVAKLKHPGIHLLLRPQLQRQFNRQAMRIDEISIHEHMADLLLLDHLGKKRLELIHFAAERQALIPVETKFMQREAHFEDGHPMIFKVPSKATKKRANRPHQQQNGTFDIHGNHFSPPPSHQTIDITSEFSPKSPRQTILSAGPTCGRCAAAGSKAAVAPGAKPAAPRSPAPP